MKQPKLSFWQIWNVSFGFFGVQIGFALQNANMSRVFSDLGANLYSLSFMWLLAPLMGVIIQPLVGASSDRTWTRLGRRSPFILAGALTATIAMILMPQAPLFVSFIMPMVFGLIMLAIMDAAFNVAFQPFRALVSDMVPGEQRNQGYSIQSLLINMGAIIGSILPFVLTNVLLLSNEAELGEVAETVAWSFYLGAFIMLASVLWTVVKTKEYAPAEYRKYKGLAEAPAEADHKSVSEKIQGMWQLMVTMPKTMKQLSFVQFFSWFPMFLMWVYILAAITQTSWGIDPKWFNADYIKSVDSVPADISAAKGSAGDWLGILYAMMYIAAALFSTVMGKMANTFGRKFTYAIGLLAGAVGFLSMGLFTHSQAVEVNLLIAQVEVPAGAIGLIIPMIGVGIAWAAIIAMPYSILAGALPADKTGVYMGIFNFTVAGPQIVCGIIAGPILLYLFDNHAIGMMWLAGASLVLGAISVCFVNDSKEVDDLKDEVAETKAAENSPA
ncbi:major facilitator family transporter [Catenovulum agarivorans DS-2]|uniref:Major facilitator family transporter n=1 Tax=Catenovulum agarivorans DS-2 TaxID=1328313 RepID=W7Q5T0_9ALTE|nr:MFS transporter [Catenovulum agarivorans]EWH08134.1 major facilitator family transporter [Catenovulum agarivorans DS-2]